MLTQQRLLFASLASSTFLIYLDPQHGTNAVPILLERALLWLLAHYPRQFGGASTGPAEND